MQLNKNEWKNLDEYFNVFQHITTHFIEDLDDEKAAKINASLELSGLENLRLSDTGHDLETCINKLEKDIIPQLSAARGSRFWAFVTGGATPVATLADWLVSVFDQNVHKSGDSIASDVELQAIQWLLELFDLPNTFDGIMTTGGTACNFLGVCSARQFAGKKQHIDIAKEGVYNLSLEIFSTTPHASTIKSLGMAGLGQRNYTQIKALKNSEKIDVEDLKLRLNNSTAKAQFVIASAGTVTATDFDDLVAIADLCQEHDAWLHVDAAFGLFERLVTGINGKTKGIDRADSITVDCHKWLNVPYDCGVFLTQHRNLLEESFDVSARYLARTSEIPDFMSLGVENSRRFRAFPVWLSLLAYGKQGIKNWVVNNIQHSKKIANWIDSSIEYELCHPCQMNVVLFRPNCDGLSDEQADKKTLRLIQIINSEGTMFISPGIWNEHEVIRLCLSNWQTDESDVEVAINTLKGIY